MDDLIAFREDKDRFFRTHPSSPLTLAQKAVFSGLRYFDYNPALVFTLKIEEFPEKANLKMQTTTGDSRYYLRFGKVRFQVEGKEAELTLFATPGSTDFFVPFMDATSGTLTYSAGRYLEVERLTKDTIHLDFNLAYSPYCAYNEPEHFVQPGQQPMRWTCPIPPKENRLGVPILAGEMTPIGEWAIPDHA